MFPVGTRSFRSIYLDLHRQFSASKVYTVDTLNGRQMYFLCPKRPMVTGTGVGVALNKDLPEAERPSLR